MWLSKVVSIILVHIIFMNICLAKSGDGKFNFDRSQFVLIGQIGPKNEFQFLKQGQLIHPQAVITVSHDSLYEAESLLVTTDVPLKHHSSASDNAKSVTDIVELPETSKIVLLILEEEISNIKLINYKHTSYDDQYNECKLIKLNYRELDLGGTEIIPLLKIKEKNIQLLSHMPDKGCPSKLNKIVDFKSSLFTDYIYCIKEIKRRNCRNDYPGASLVCQDHETSEFYLAGVVIGKSRCNWMLINTPKLHASIEDHLKTIQ